MNMKSKQILFLLPLLFVLVLNANTEFYTPQDDLDSLSGKSSDNDLPNVLIIGDSISIGYTPEVVKLLDGIANVSRPVRDNGKKLNCGDTKRGLEQLSKWLGDKKWDVIHFNWGLHDLCYRHPDSKVYGRRDKVNGSVSVSIEEYKRNLELLVERLSKTDALLIWASTTLVPEGEVGRHVGDDLKYNEVANAIMKGRGIVINDLHKLTSSFDASLFREPGDVHYTKIGYEKLARQVASEINKALTRRE